MHLACCGHLGRVSDGAKDDVLLPHQQHSVHLGPILTAESEKHIEEEAECQDGGSEVGVEGREVSGQHERPHQEGGGHRQKDEPGDKM